MRIQELDYNVDLLQYIAWQYDQSNLAELIQNRQAAINDLHRDFWDNWYRDVFDLRTANNFGCNVWALIHGVDFSNRIPIAGRIGFGYGEHRLNYTVPPRTGGNYVLRDGSNTSDLPVELKRIILRFRAFVYFNDISVPNINAFLADIFSNDGPAYVVDNLDMSMVYRLNFPVTDILRFALDNYDILPQPAGVSVSYEVI